MKFLRTDDGLPKRLVVTTAFVERGEGDERELILSMSKSGIGVGKRNGFGGKVNPGESVDEAAARELSLRQHPLRLRTLRRKRFCSRIRLPFRSAGAG